MSAAAPPARRPATSSTARPARTGRWSRASTRRKARVRSATTWTTDRFRRSRSAAARRARRVRCLAFTRVLVSKSGGNRYTGSFYGDYESKDWQSFNIDDAQMAAGVTGGGGLEPRDVNRLNSYRDLNADIGGFLKKDAIWWYASVRSLDSAVRYTNFPVKPHETHLGNFTSKVTYQLSQNNKLIGYYQPSTKVQKNRLDRQLARRHCGDSSHRRRELPAGLQPAPVEGGMELGDFAVDVLRGSHRTVRLRVARHAERHRVELRGPEHEHRVGKGSHAAAQHPAHAAARVAQLLQERLGGQSQLQGRLGMVPRDEHARSGSPGRTTTCCTCFAAARHSK